MMTHWEYLLWNIGMLLGFMLAWACVVMGVWGIYLGILKLRERLK